MKDTEKKRREGTKGQKRINKSLKRNISWLSSRLFSWKTLIKIVVIVICRMLRQLEHCAHVSVTLIQLRILKVPIKPKNGLANNKLKKQNVLSLSSPDKKCTQQEFDPKAKFLDNFYEEQAVLLVLRQ